jgi:hypothetical protein
MLSDREKAQMSRSQNESGRNTDAPGLQCSGGRNEELVAISCAR